MSGVDNRIVTLQFNNRQFEQSAATSLTTLQKIKQSMDFGTIASSSIKAIGSIGTALSKVTSGTRFEGLVTNAQKGFGLIGGFIDKLGLKNPFSSSVQGASDLQRAAQAAGGPAGMGVLEGGVTAVSSRFIALSTIAITALSNITNRAINSGASFLKSFSIQPIMDGLHEYELNLKSIQVVQANTDRPLPEIEDALQRLNKYSDQTIYNFSEMARNVGTFTAAGVDLETSVSAIKGIANLAALSGSSSEQAATAMYQLSQAIAAGKVGLMDWNSVVNAGMGGKKLQNALAQTAIAMGELDKRQVKLVGSMDKLEIKGQSFRESIMAQPGEESWLSSEALVNTLASMDGRFSEVALAAEKTEKGLQRYTKAEIQAKIQTARLAMEQKNGVKYTDEQFAALQKMSTMAFKSATEVKTLGQVFQVARESIGSGWAASFKNIFGGLKDAKKLFTGMSSTLGEIINQNALARNKLLAAWAEGGGRLSVIEGLKNVWESFYGIVKAVGEGFRDIFPAKTSADLIAMSRNFLEFTQSLLPSKATLADIRDIAGGVFAVFGIGKQILGGVVTMFRTIFDTVGVGNGSFLDTAASVGRLIEEFNNFLEESGLVTAFFQGLGSILSVPLTLLKGVGSVITAIFSGFDSGAAEKVGDAVGTVGDRLSGLQIIAEKVKEWLGNIGELFAGLGAIIGKALVGIGDVVAGAFTADTFGSTLDVINTTLLGALVLLIRNFFTKGVNVDLTGGLFDGIKETLGSATGAFEQMQNNLKADVIMKLAAAIAVMAAALLVLSMIDPAALTKALAAMTGGFAILIGAMATLLKVMGPAGLVQLYVITTAMTKMAASILLLAFALRIMSSINFGDMLRGLVGLAAAMFILQKAMVPLAAGSKGMAKASFSLILVGIALNLLAVALKVMATMSWEEMAKGLIMMTGALGGIALAMKLMPKGIALQAAGILILSVAMNALAVALKIFATMSWDEMAHGLAALAGSLVVIGLAMRLMPKTMIITAAGLAIVAGAMVVLSGALKVMGSMGWEQIAKGLVTLAGALLIIGIGLQVIGVVGTIGAVGLLATAAALVILMPVLLAFANMSWEGIGKSMVMLVGLFTVLGVAATLAGLQIVVLGAGMLLLGAGVALLGSGLLAAATAFGIVVAAGAAGIQILVGLLATIIAAIPPALKAFGEGVVAFAVAIGNGAPAVATAFGKILTGILEKVRDAIPKVGDIFMRLIGVAARVIGQGAPKLYNAGLDLILGFLRAVASHVGDIVDSATDIIVNFLNALGRSLPRIIQAGVKLVISFVNGVAEAIRDNDEEMGKAGANLATALIEGVVNGIRSGADLIKDAALEAAKGAWEAAKDFFKIGSPSKLARDELGRRIPQGMALGIKDDAPLVVKEIGDLGTLTMSKMGEAMKGIDDALALDPNFNPTVTPVLDLAGLTQEANKMSSILATAPIVAGVSYQTAAEISAMTQPSSDDGPDDGTASGGGGDQNIELHLHQHSPKPLDSVAAWRGGKSLISLAKEALK